MSSIPDRLFKISKSYLDQVRDRIDAELTERERAQAEQELRGRGEDTSLPPFAAQNGNGTGRGDSEFHTADDMMRRAEERIAAARRERQSRTQTGETPAPPAASNVPAASVPIPSPSDLASDDPNAPDYRVLGVPVGSDLTTVLGAYEKLTRRLDPTRLSFPEGSVEQKEAARILARINTSYENLRKRLDPTENRFGKLELE